MSWDRGGENDGSGRKAAIQDFEKVLPVRADENPLQVSGATGFRSQRNASPPAGARVIQGGGHRFGSPPVRYPGARVIQGGALRRTRIVGEKGPESLK